jgi:hypothetical protein
MRIYELDTCSFFSFDFGGTDYPPTFGVQMERLERRGLEPLLRSLGSLPQQPFQLIAKTYFASDAAAEAQLTIFNGYANNATPLRIRRTRNDGTVLDFDSQGVRFVIFNAYQQRPGITMQAVPIAHVQAPGAVWAGAKVKATFTFNLQAVFYP